MRRLRDKEEIAAEIGADGQYPGREPLCRPARRLPLHAQTHRATAFTGRATRHAAAKVLARRACRPRRRACRGARRGHRAQAQRADRLGGLGDRPARDAARRRSSRAFSSSPTSTSRRRSASGCRSASKPGSTAELQRQARAADGACAKRRTCRALPAGSLTN